MNRDQNGTQVSKDIRHEPDGTWSRNVWWGSGVVTDVQRRYGYATRKSAEAGGINESASETNRRVKHA